MKYKPFTIRFLRYLWRFKLTPAGKWLLAAILFTGLAGSLSVDIPVYQIFCALIALYVVTWLAGLFFRPRIVFAGRLPENTTVGEIVAGGIEITNRSRWSAYDLMFSLLRPPKPVEHLDRDFLLRFLPAGESATIPVSLRAHRRGLYELSELSAHSTFPFNLFRNGSARHDLGSLLVLPAFHPLIGIDIDVGSRYQPGGIALTSNVGESPEYIGNREYVPGESMRRLDFRSWARTGTPVVREYQEEYYCRIALILDTFIAPKRRPRRSGFAELEGAVSLTAAAADALSHGEYLIDLFAAGPELYLFRAGRHMAHFDNLLEILSCVDACRKNPFDLITPAVSEELDTISSAVCLFLDWDASRRRLTQAVLEAGCSLKVIIVRDSPTTEPLGASDLVDIEQYGTEQIRGGRIDFL